MASQSFWDSYVVGYWDSQVLSHARAGRAEELRAALTAGGRARACDPSSAGDTALLLAARSGHPACCRLLLEHGADADAQGSCGETALMAAIVAGSTELVELLLPATADLAAKTDTGLCALALACLHRRPSALRLLLRRQHALLTGTVPLGGDAGGSSHGHGTGTSTQLAATDDYSAAPLSRRLAAGQQLLPAMYAAVASGDAACLQQLADHPLARAAYDAQFGASAAAAAAAAPLRMPGQDSCSLQDGLSFLLDASVVGQRNVRAASFLWQTTGAPTHLAAATDRPDCLRVLLSSGIGSPDERTTSEGFTPLMLAATADAAAAAAVLLQAGAALEARNHASRTALFLAAVSGSAGVLSLLITAGAEVDAAEQARGYSPLTAAIARAASAEASRQPQATALAACAAQLLAAGADVVHAARDGSTPLHAAAEGGSVACINLLVSSGAPVDAADSAGRTPLAGAVLGRAPRVVCALRLLEHGASVPSGELASRLLACLLQGERRGSGDPYSTPTSSLVTVWRLLAALNVQQLRVLSDCPQFYDLPHTDGPEEPLPAAALAAVMKLAAADCSNLLYSASPSDCAAQGRRPAYLFELLRRAAAPDSGDGTTGAQASSGSRAGWVAVRAAVQVELCQGGSQQLVTAASLERYIALLVQYKQVDVVAGACCALGRGLRGVVTRSVLDTMARCFSHEELNTLVAGQSELDAGEWQAAARHEGGCERAPQLAWFWSMVDRMCQSQRRQLLAFVTSSGALPAGGFAALRGFNGAPHPFTVSLVVCEGDERLPRVSTCFNHLFLPAYSSAAVLEERVQQAITGAQAFDEGVIRR